MKFEALIKSMSDSALTLTGSGLYPGYKRCMDLCLVISALWAGVSLGECLLLYSYFFPTEFCVHIQ